MIALFVCPSDGCTVLLTGDGTAAGCVRSGIPARWPDCVPVAVPPPFWLPSASLHLPCALLVEPLFFHTGAPDCALDGRWRFELTDSHLSAKRAGFDQWHSLMIKQECRSELRSNPLNAKEPLMAGILPWHYKKSGTPTYESQYGISETSYYLKHRPDIVLDTVNFCIDCGRVGLNHAYLGL